MNSLIILPEECVDASCAVLHGARAFYAYHTHGLRTGQRVKAGVLGGLRGEALAKESGPERVALELFLSLPPLLARPIDLIIGVSRPQTIKKAVQSAVMLGVRSLHFVRSEKGEKSYLQSTSLLEENLQDESLKALEQVWDTRGPAITVHRSFAHFSEKRLASWQAEPGAVRLIAHPLGHPVRAAAPNGSRQGATLAIGPERGWSEEEVKAFEAHGFAVVGLGERVLRVEIAATFLIGQLDALSQPA